MSAGLDVTDVRPGRLIAEHPPGEEDCILAQRYVLEWRCNGVLRRLVIIPGFRFFPGVNRMPLPAKLFLRLVGVTKMLHSSLPHDGLYVIQGGRREPDRVYLTDEAGEPVSITRREADLIAFHIARAERVHPRAAKVIKFAIRRFGKDAWDD